MLGIQPVKPVEAAGATGLFFSEYIEGSSNNKALEIYNGTGAPVDLQAYKVVLYANGSPTPGNTLTWSTPTLIADGDVYVIANASASAPILAQADVTSNVTFYNGDDAIALQLVSDSSNVDVIGQIGVDPGASWGTEPITTVEHTLTRKVAICGGDSDGSNAFDPAVEWDGYVQDTFTYLGSHTASCGPQEIFPTELFISEYIEGSSNNKALEIYNGTGTAVDLQAYKVVLFSNGSPTPSATLTWATETLIADGDVYVIAHPSAAQAILDVADILSSTVANFNGDDAVSLQRVSDNSFVDVIGQIGFDPGTFWGTEPITTINHTLTRMETVCEGDPDGTNAFDPAVEWDGYAQDTFTHLGSHTTNCFPSTETAPSVASTSPANGGEIATGGNLTITFSEPVTLADLWYDITCSTSGTHTAAVTDADPVFTLDPDTNFVAGETCTVTVYAAKVTDDDTEDPPDTMESDYVFTFSVAYGCGDPFTAIPAIQGNSTASPLVGQVVSTEGIVTADYQTSAYVSGTKNGFFMQSETGDGDPATSEGLFIYSYLTDVHVGDHVRVTGTVKEQYDLTELSPVTRILVCSTGNTIEPTEFSLPAASLLDFEKLEGMYVTIPQELSIVEYYNFDQFGEIVLGTERFMQFTAANEPDPTGFAAWNADMALNSILLDDSSEVSNPDPARHPNGLPFTLENLFRGGDKLTNVIGVMDYNFSKYRIQPTAGADYEAVNLRTTAPDVLPGDLTIASFNVLNYFTTIDTGALICGPLGNVECRGADTAEELTRQRDKILAALLVIDADVTGIMEIENDRPVGDPDYAVADLVAGLNAAAGEGTFAYIATGAIGTDAIKQAIIYKPAAVTPVGTYQLLTTAVDSRFIDTLNRPALAQVFEDALTGESFVVAVNHLKSKGSACTGDPDLLDGAGNCNLTRKAAAQALVDWLANPVYFPDVENALIIGDLNSYDYEDPIDMIKLGADDAAATGDDYVDLMKEIRGEDAYGYLYGSQLGYLDYALANPNLAQSVVDVNFWHINADESDLINYDMTYKLPAQDAIFAPDAYRSSDHDPVILTLSFNSAPVANNMTVTTAEDSPLDIDLDVSDANGDELTTTILTDPLHGSLDILGTTVTYTPDENYYGPDSFTYKVNDGELDSDEATVTITVTPVDDAPLANNMTVTTPEDASLAIPLDVSDIEGDVLVVTILTDPLHGSLEVLGTTVTYTPDENYYCPDSFTYKVNDGELDSGEATVTITVTPVDDAPVAVGATYDLVENGSIVFNLDASDVDGDELSFIVTVQPLHGSLECTGAVCTYTPMPGWYGQDSLSFKVNDGTLDSNEAVVTLRVTALPRIYLPIAFK
ncbi:MAG: ExeM/NucH family extracellular endonuclease [Anaerolineaceae bacterium]